MSIIAIARIEETELKGLRLLDTESRQVKDVTKSSLVKALQASTIKIENIGLGYVETN